MAYTDGSCIEGGARGGWSSVIYCNDKIVAQLYQGYLNTTNNRMELRGVIETLKYFKEPIKITIVSDSQYVVNSINGKHCYKWIKDNDLSKKNLDLWFELIELLDKHDVTLKWVKGHNDDSKNEYADLLAQHASSCMNLPEDPINIKWNDTRNNNSKIS